MRDLFDSATVEGILAIPLVRNGSADRRFWGYNKNGFYLVKSCYCLGFLGAPRGTLYEGAVDNSNMWKVMRQLSAPPKLSHFLWRACKNSLPVNVVCHYRHMTSSPTCSRCNEGPESIFHALFDCNKVCEMWKSHPYFDSVHAAPRDSFVDCFLWLHSHSSTDGFENICASMFSRNKEVMDGSQSNIEQLSTAYVKMLKEY